MAKNHKLDKWETQHRRNLTAIERKVDELYREAVREAASISTLLGNFSPEKPFSFADYPITQDRTRKLLEGLKTNLESVIVNGVRSEWTLANNKNNELCNQVFGDYVGALSEEQYRRYYSTNPKAEEAFLARTEQGMNLSDRVWKYTDQFKREIEMGLDLGLREGLSADAMSRQLRSFLQHPDTLFRRVRDEHGQLHLSKAAQAYHPGRGVYRSSYKNARRLAATECNIAYRTADYERWQQLDFVVGIRVVLSNNHTLNGVPFEDICDQLSAPLGSKETSGRGCYPKDFLFTGWHPLCRCHTESILKTREEMMEDNARILAGKPISTRSENTVDDVPMEFKNWITNNESRIAKAKSLPYFIRNNQGVVDDILGGNITQSAPISLPKTQKKQTVDFEEINRRFEIENSIGHTIRLEQTTLVGSPVSGVDFIELDDEMNRIFAEHGMPKLSRKIILDIDTVTIRYGEEWGSKAYIERVFGINGKHRFVDHEYFAVSDEYQGKGFSKDVIKAFYKQYRKNGTRFINVHANIDVGGYCWGKYGFYANDKSNVERAIRWKNLNNSESEEIRNIIEEFYCDKFDNEAFPMIKIASLPYGRKALLNSNWYGQIDLHNDEQRELFESYLGV